MAARMHTEMLGSSKNNTTLVVKPIVEECR